MQTRSEEFRNHAAECQAIANSFSDSEIKRQYEVLASQWRELAERTERRSTLRQAA